MKYTSIQWTHSTINPTSGCDGCELYRRPPANLTTPEQLKAWRAKQPCYAAQVHEIRWANSLAITHPDLYAKSFSEVRTIPGRIAKAASWGPVTDDEAAEKPWLTSRRRHIFISDMADALSRDVPFEFLRDEIIDGVRSAKGQRHIWQWLTKHPDRMVQFDEYLKEHNVPWPDNLWAGTSVTSQRTADVRVPALLKVRAKVRFLSCEPLFEAVDLRVGGDGVTYLDALRGLWFCDGRNEPSETNRLHWVIVGGASGGAAVPFDIAWARSIIAQCKSAAVPCFVKQLGAKPVDHHPQSDLEFDLDLKDSHGGDWNEWSEGLRVREFPA